VPPRSPRDQHPDEVQRLATLLKRLQEVSGMSQIELGERLNHSRSAMNRYLNGNEVLPETSLDSFLNLTEASPADRQQANALMAVITGDEASVPPMPPPAAEVLAETVIDMSAPGSPLTGPEQKKVPATASSMTSFGTEDAQPTTSTAELAHLPELEAGRAAPQQRGNTSAEDNAGPQSQDETTNPLEDGEPDANNATAPPPKPDPPTVPGQDRPRSPHKIRMILMISGGVALIAVTAVVTALLVERRQESQRQCAFVNTPTKTSAPVYLEIGQQPVKDKRHGERVEIYQTLNPAITPEGKYLPVFVREDGMNTYGWMLEHQLKPAAC